MDQRRTVKMATHLRQTILICDPPVAAHVENASGLGRAAESREAASVKSVPMATLIQKQAHTPMAKAIDHAVHAFGKGTPGEIHTAIN
jgi:hypothetical protein